MYTYIFLKKKKKTKAALLEPTLLFSTDHKQSWQKMPWQGHPVTMAETGPIHNRAKMMKYSSLRINPSTCCCFTNNHSSLALTFLPPRQILLKYPTLVAQTIKRLPIMRETRVQSLGREDPLEKEMATHSSTLAWRIPWTEKPGRLQSMWSQRVGHDWATSISLSLSPDRSSSVITSKLEKGLVS